MMNCYFFHSDEVTRELTERIADAAGISTDEVIYRIAIIFRGRRNFLRSYGTGESMLSRLKRIAPAPIYERIVSTFVRGAGLPYAPRK